MGRQAYGDIAQILPYEPRPDWNCWSTILPGFTPHGALASGQTPVRRRESCI